MSESVEERRPRPIGVVDESEEDSDMERNDAAGAAGAGADKRAADSTAVAAPEEIITKVSKKIRAFSENDLVKEKGLLKIYNDFPQKCQYKGKGREV